MTDPDRIEKILALLEAVWKKYPDFRLGQLLINVKGYEESHDLWHLEDDVLIERLVAWAQAMAILTPEEIEDLKP